MKLQLLDTCTPDNFQGYGGPVINLSVDARTTARQLYHDLVNDDGWPEGLTEDEIKTAVYECIGGAALKQDIHLFPDVYPDDDPVGFHVRQHPTIKDMWLVFDDDYDIIGSYGTQGEAMCVAWAEASPPDSHRNEPVYAYFGVSLEVPDGYRVAYSEDLGWFYSSSLEGTAADGHGFDTEFEAKVAAWRHVIAELPNPTFETEDRAVQAMYEAASGVPLMGDETDDSDAVSVCRELYRAGYRKIEE